MKTKLQILIVSLLITFAVKRGNTQILIQFWDFNQVRPISGAGGDSVGTVFSYANTPAVDSANSTWPLTANYKANGLTAGHMVYSRPQFEYSAGNPENLTDCDGPGGGAYIYDYSSSHYSYYTSSDSGFTEGNAFLKSRNPSDSCVMYMYIPTTGYKNISLQYAISQSSVKGATYNVFSYSTNGGTSWKNLTRAMDTFNIGGNFKPDTLQMTNPTTVSSNWYPVQINFSSDASVNNNAGFILRWMMIGANTILTSGNDRYDNFAVWATGPSGIDELTAEDAGYTLYPNPAKDNITLYGTHQGQKEVSIYNVVGQEMTKTIVASNQSLLNVSELSAGVYFMTVKEIETGSIYTLKFVKN
jgi:hypothetical protein